MASKIPTLFVVPDFYQSELLVIGGSVQPTIAQAGEGTFGGFLINQIPFLGNNLSVAGFKAWLNPDQVQLPQSWQRLNLGINLNGLRIVTGAVTLDQGFGYAPLGKSLVEAVKLQWGIRPWPYDWRQSYATLGQQLAADIVAYGQLANQQAIMAIGYGALVAQWAMALLKQQGRDNLIQAVIAVAPTFSGSYAAAQMWRKQSNALQIGPPPSRFLGSAGRAFGGALGLAGDEALEQAMVGAFNSWPSVYDVLPDPGLSDDPRDLQRSQVWQASTWSTAPIPPNAALLAAAQARQSTLHSAAYAPDRAKWRVVAVVNPRVQTPAQLVPGFAAPARTDPALTWYFTLPQFTRTPSGDGRATLGSQNPYSLPQLTFEGVNWGVPVSRALSDQLLQLLQAAPTGTSLHRGL